MPCVLITGSNRNLGLAFAQHYARAGWRVMATFRDVEKAGELAGIAQRAEGGTQMRRRAGTCKCGRGQANGAPLGRGGPRLGPGVGRSVDRAADRSAHQRRVDPGQAPGKHRSSAFGETDYSEWGEIFATNTVGGMMVAEAFADHVAASGRGVIATISSRLGSEPTYRLVPYRISKTALNQVVMQIALALRERGVISVALHPGWVQNDISGTRAVLTPDESAAMLAGVIGGLTIADTGKFFEPDGSELPLITQQFADKPYSMPKGRPV